MRQRCHYKAELTSPFASFFSNCWKLWYQLLTYWWATCNIFQDDCCEATIKKKNNKRGSSNSAFASRNIANQFWVRYVKLSTDLMFSGVFTVVCINWQSEPIRILHCNRNSYTQLYLLGMLQHHIKWVWSSRGLYFDEKRPDVPLKHTNIWDIWYPVTTAY